MHFSIILCVVVAGIVVLLACGIVLVSVLGRRCVTLSNGKGGINRRRVLHLGSEHKGCVADIQTVCSQLQVELVSYNVLTMGDTVKSSNDRYNVTQELADEIWNTNNKLFLSCDVWLVSDTSPMARILIGRQPNRPLVVWGCNRADYAHKPSNFPKAEFYETFRSAKNMAYVPYTAFEARHVRQRFNMHVDHPILPPVGGQPNGLILPKKSEVFCPPYINDALGAQALHNAGIPYERRRYSSTADVAQYKAVLHIPYAWSNFAPFEHWSAGVPYVIPSIAFLRTLLAGKEYPAGTKNFNPFFSPPMLTQHFEDCVFYRDELHAPVKMFDTWKQCNDLIQKLLDENETQVRNRRQAIVDWHTTHYTKMVKRWKNLLIHNLIHMPKIPPIVINVVNLDSQPERLRNLEEETKDMRIKIVRFSAIKPSSPFLLKFAREHPTPVDFAGKTAKPTELACALSHRGLWMGDGVPVSSDSDWILVAEDDCIRNKHYSSAWIEHMVRTALARAPSSLQFIQFAAGVGIHYHDRNILGEQLSQAVAHHGSFVEGIAFSTVCYAIRKEAARELAASYAQNQPPPPIDFHIRKTFIEKNTGSAVCRLRGFKTYYDGTGIFYNDHRFESNIEKERTEK